MSDLVSEHALLCAKLAKLVDQAKASFATVIDDGGHLFAWSRVLTPDELGRVGSYMDEALASTKDKPLRRGGRIRLFAYTPGRHYVAMSYAGIYVLLVAFDDTYALGPAMAHVRRELPEIEQMTVALPPDGPTKPRKAARKRQ